MNSHPLKPIITTHAIDTLGFDDCRFTTPFLSEHLNDYREWVTQKNYGDMGYLERHLPLKENPNLLLDGVQSAIVLIKNYKNTEKKHLDAPLKVARYAAGQDYHMVITEKLNQLELFIKEQNPSIQTYAGVDSRPLAERSLALQAGIGFRGKNTMVIRPKLGSYFFIGVILTTATFELDSPFKGSCGTCQRCIDACPTQALSLEGAMTPTKCISYQTIEKKTPVSQEALSTFQGWQFGCDICQEVCPFNHGHTPLTNWAEFKPEAGIGFSLKNLITIPKESALYRSRKRVLESLHGVA